MRQKRGNRGKLDRGWMSGKSHLMTSIVYLKKKRVLSSSLIYPPRKEKQGLIFI